MKCNCEKCQAWQVRQEVEDVGDPNAGTSPGSHGWMRPHMPEYGPKESEALPTGLYLGVFHGLDSPYQELDGLGSQGPMIGPMQYVHCTYMCHVEFAFVDVETARKYFGDRGANSEEGNFDVENGLLNVGDGKYYGAWTVFWHVQGKGDA